jgi:hypothetical protein
MKQILYFTFSCLILFCPGRGIAQEKITKSRGFRFGTDVSKFFLPLFYPETKGYELLADLQITDNIFIAGEFGISSTRLDTDSYSFNYNLNGRYFKIGINKNMLKQDDKTKNDLVFVGIRYSYTGIKHKATNISIADDHWDEEIIVETGEHNLKCHYIDVVAGVKTELFKNIFMGWTIRGMIRLAPKSYGIMTPYIIPGFGKGSRKASLGFNYSIYYRIPYKIAVKKKN